MALKISSVSTISGAEAGRSPTEGAESGRRSEAGTEAGSSQQQPPPTPPVVVLSSTGPSAEYRGDCLGVFDYVQQYNNSPAYRQRHTVAGTQPKYLYKDGYWRVGRELGGSTSYLKNTSRSGSVPSNNWQYYYGGRWKSDPELTVTTSLPSVCGVIRISLHGAAATWPETGGDYRPTGDWSAGRPVFSNGLTYLCVRPEWSGWYVRDRPDSDGARLWSGCVTWCPASPRAAVRHRANISSWRYWKNDWRNGDIRVTCDTHQH